MDNLTHSLVGALIGQAGLKRRTGLAMPALIIGANIPDIDATCVLLGEMQHLALRRGVTHGPIAWVLLPLALAGALWWFDRWQATRGKRPEGRLPVRFGWLYALSFIACLTHPGFDWLNSYGIRLFEPFSGRWFYGDVLFIIDVWLWLGLGFATWLSLSREKQGGEWRRPAQAALAGVLAYIGLNFGISTAARWAHTPYDEKILSPVPVAFWSRQLIGADRAGQWYIDGQRLSDLPLEACDLAAAGRTRRDLDAFLFWSRAPYVTQTPSGWRLSDARFSSRGTSRFSVELPAETCRS